MRMRDELTGEYVEFTPEQIARLEESRRRVTEEELDAEMIEAMNHPERFKTYEQWMAEYDAMVRRQESGGGGS